MVFCTRKLAYVFSLSLMRVSLFHFDYVATCSIAVFFFCAEQNQKRKIAWAKSRHTHTQKHPIDAQSNDRFGWFSFYQGSTHIRFMFAAHSRQGLSFAKQFNVALESILQCLHQIFKCIEKHLDNFFYYYLCLIMKYEMFNVQIIIQNASLAIALISHCSGWVSFLFAARNTLTLKWLESSTLYRLWGYWKINENSSIHIVRQ